MVKIIPRDPASANAFLRPYGVAPVLPMAMDAKPKPRRRGGGKNGEMLLRPVHPNAGIEADYRRRILRLVDEMAASVSYWLKARYRANEPKIMAMDDLPASELQDAVDKMTRQWRERFAEGAPKLAKYFAKAAAQRSDAALMRILKDAGFTVDFKMTAVMRDVLNATIEQNVGLIKSIPEQYLTQIQGAVMRSVQSGRDLGSLASELEHQYGVTRRRAALIARNQNNMATASMSRVRQQEVGIEEAVWLHSHGGREPRPTHLANTGKRYKVAEGWFDPAVKEHIWPGQLINCRCVAKPVVKGFS